MKVLKTSLWIVQNDREKHRNKQHKQIQSTSLNKWFNFQSLNEALIPQKVNNAAQVNQTHVKTYNKNQHQHQAVINGHASMECDFVFPLWALNVRTFSHPAASDQWTQHKKRHSEYLKYMRWPHGKMYHFLWVCITSTSSKKNHWNGASNVN